MSNPPEDQFWSRPEQPTSQPAEPVNQPSAAEPTQHIDPAGAAEPTVGIEHTQRLPGTEHTQELPGTEHTLQLPEEHTVLRPPPAQAPSGPPAAPSGMPQQPWNQQPQQPGNQQPQQPGNQQPQQPWNQQPTSQPQQAWNPQADQQPAHPQQPWNQQPAQPVNQPPQGQQPWNQQPGQPQPQQAQPWNQQAGVVTAPAGWQQQGSPAPAQRRQFRVDNPLPGIVSALIGIGIAYAASAIILGIAMAGGALHSGSGGPLSDITNVSVPDVVHGVWNFVCVVAQMVPMAFLSAVHGKITGDFAFSLSVRFPVLAVTALFAVATYLAAHRSAASRRVGSRVSALVEGGVAGLLTATVVTAVARLCAVPASSGADKSHVHAASALGFVVALLLTAAVVYCGRVRGSGLPVLGSHPLLQEAGRSVGVFVYHLAAFALTSTVVVGLYVFIKGWVRNGFKDAFGMMLSLPLIWGHGVTTAFAQQIFGAGKVDFSLPRGTADAPNDLLTIFTYKWYETTALFVVAVICLGLAALAWQRVRRVGRVNQQAVIASWVMLPAVYLLGGLVLFVLDRASADASYSSYTVNVGVHLTWWTLPLFAVLGLLVDVVARFAAPFLGFVPTRLYARGGTAPGPMAALGGSSRPMSPETRKRALIGTIAGLAVLALGISGAAVYAHTQAAKHAPDLAVRAYLDALKAGDADKAVQLMGATAPTEASALMNTAVYSKATDRVSDYTIDKVRTGSNSGTVTATVKHGASSDAVTFTVRKVEGNPDWTVTYFGTTGRLSVALPSGTQKLLVNGVDVNASSSMVYLPAFPGTYQVALPDQGKYLVGGKATATVGYGTSSSYQRLEYTVSPQLETDIKAKVKVLLDACAKSKDPRPVNCPFRSYSAWGTVRNGSWKINTYPALKINQSYPENEFRISTDYNAGQATYTYEMDEGWDKPDWKKHSDKVGFYLFGRATIQGDQLTVSLS